MTERVSRPRVKAPVLLPSDSLRSGDVPLAQMLQSTFSEHSVPILWHRIQGRLHEPVRPRLRWPLALAMASAMVVLAFVGFTLVRNSNTSPLRLSSGQLPAALVAEATPRHVALSDGSSIEVSQQSRLEVVSNDNGTFVTALSRGSATFEVNPKAKRRWVIEVGLTSVEVVGTRFTVTRTESEVAVSVQRGLVLVRGATVPGGQQRLGAGQALRAPTTTEAAADKKTARMGRTRTDDEATSPSAPDKNEEDSDEASTATIIDADELLHVEELGVERTTQGASDKGARSKGPAATNQGVGTAEGTPSAAAGAGEEVASKVPPQIEALLAEADHAREAGDVGRSLQFFERVIAIAPRFDPRRGLAAMSVARMTMRSNPARAAAALRATLDGMPAALQENATARLVEAYAKSGQTKSAQQVAKRYLERFPNGRRAEDVRRWAGP